MPSWEDGSDKRLAEYRGETVYDRPGAEPEGGESYPMAGRWNGSKFCGCHLHRETPKRIVVEECSLHAAAGDLLAALRDLMASCANWAPTIDRSRARAAIAKAEGDR